MGVELDYVQQFRHTPTKKIHVFVAPYLSFIREERNRSSNTILLWHYGIQHIEQFLSMSVQYGTTSSLRTAVGYWRCEFGSDCEHRPIPADLIIVEEDRTVYRTVHPFGILRERQSQQQQNSPLVSPTNNNESSTVRTPTRTIHHRRHHHDQHSLSLTVPSAVP